MRPLGKHNVSYEASPLWAQASSRLNSEEIRAAANRFWPKVRIGDPVGCWLWVARRFPRGYGQFTWSARYGRGTPVGAHRVAWELVNGPIPEGKHVLHSCDNRACVNPKHLFLGDHLSNMQDAAQKGRLHVSRPRAQKVTDEQALAIIAAVRAGAKQADLATQYGVSKGAISQFVSGLRRPWLQQAVSQKAS